MYERIVNSIKRYFSPNEQRSEARNITTEQFFWGKLSSAGIPINENTAKTIPAYYRAIDLISTDTANLPLKVYEQQEDGNKLHMRDHPVQRLLMFSPDGEITAFKFRQTLLSHALNYGNGFAEITRKGADADKLYLLDPTQVHAKRLPDRTLVYSLPNGKFLPSENVIHISALGFDGVTGDSPTDLFNDSLAISKGTETYGATFFGNTARPGGYIEVPGTMSDEAATNLRENWVKVHAGVYGAHVPAILQNGMKWIERQYKPEDISFLETRKFQILEVCRMFNIPPHKLMDYSESHYNNIEAANRDYLQTTLSPWLKLIESEFNLKIFKPSEQGKMIVEHLTDALLRATTKDRTDQYRAFFDMGVFTQNDILKLENKPTIGPEGDKRYITKQLEKPSDE